MSVSISGDGSLTGIDQGLNVVGVVTASTFSGNVTGNITASGLSTFSSGIVVSTGTTTVPSISPSGDSNTGIFFPSADTVCIGEGGTEVLRVDSSGRVGIGTNIFASANNTRLGISSSGEGYEFSVGWGSESYNGGVIEYLNRSSPTTRPDLNLFVGGASNGSIKFWTGGAQRVNIDSSGRVITPSQPHIFGSIGNNSTQTNSFASFMNVFSSTELTFSSSRVTVPVAGLYLITFTTISDITTARRDANIYINGTSRLAMLTDDNSSGYKYRGGSLVAKLAANDYIQFYNQNWYDYLQTAYVDWRTASVTFLG